jgi:hypothetical protein
MQRGLTAAQLDLILAAKERKRVAWFAEKRALQDWERASKWLHTYEEQLENLRREFGCHDGYKRTHNATRSL